MAKPVRSFESPLLKVELFSEMMGKSYILVTLINGDTKKVEFDSYSRLEDEYKKFFELYG